jgi:hypothetical protein
VQLRAGLGTQAAERDADRLDRQVEREGRQLGRQREEHAAGVGDRFAKGDVALPEAPAIEMGAKAQATSNT